MLPNPFLAQRLGEEYTEDKLREAKQAWLIRAAKNVALAERPSSRVLVGLTH